MSDGSVIVVQGHTSLIYSLAGPAGPVGAPGGVAFAYLFRDDVIFAGTTPPWHGLIRPLNGTAGAVHTLSTGNNSYLELDRYVSPALATTLIPAGQWKFTFYAKTDDAARLQQIKADIYRVDANGAIVGDLLGAAETLPISSQVPTAMTAACFIDLQTGWDITDRVGIVISGKRISSSGTLSWYNDPLNGGESWVASPVMLLHNQRLGLDDGDYHHLSAAEYAAFLRQMLPDPRALPDGSMVQVLNGEWVLI